MNPLLTLMRQSYNREILGRCQTIGNDRDDDALETHLPLAEVDFVKNFQII